MPIVGHRGDRYVVADPLPQRFSQDEVPPLVAIMREILYRQLQPVRQRQWAVRVFRAAVWGVGAGSIAAAVLGSLRLVGWLSTTGIGWGLLLGLPIAVVAAAAVREWLKTDWLPAARAIDGHYELKDRTETALAFLRRDQAAHANELEQLQLADAVRHLQRVEAKQVVPFVLPSSFRWAAATTALAVALLCWPTGRSQVSAGPSTPLDAIVAEAEMVEEDLKELLDELPEEHDPELDAIVKELLAKAAEMKEPGVDVREALAKLSEMQSALQTVAAEFNVAATDEQMKAIGEALQSAESLQEAGQALQEGQYDKASEALAKLDTPKLDRKESRAVADKLKKASEDAAQKGMKKLSEAAKEAAEGLDKDNPTQSKNGLNKLGESAKKQGNAKKIAAMLKKQSDKLGESKSNCQGNSQGDGNQPAKKPSQKAGKGTNSNVQGDRTDLAANRNEEKIKGLKGEQGDSDVETLTTTEANEQSKRELKDVYHKYRKLSDAVLESEDIPLGHRQTIRRYFEAIRPTREEATPTPSDSTKE